MGNQFPFAGIILGLDNGPVLSQDNKIQKLSRNMSQALALVFPNGICAFDNMRRPVFFQRLITKPNTWFDQVTK